MLFYEEAGGIFPPPSALKGMYFRSIDGATFEEMADHSDKSVTSIKEL